MYWNYEVIASGSPEGIVLLHYPSAATSTFGPSSAYHSSRPPLDPNFRTALELKHRGPTLESTRLTERREVPLVNSQEVDDSS